MALEHIGKTIPHMMNKTRIVRALREEYQYVDEWTHTGDDERAAIRAIRGIAVRLDVLDELTELELES